MSHLSLRLRIFLFFCLIASGCIAVTLLALWLGYRQMANPEAMSVFMTSAIVAGFGITGLVIFIWLLFDENLSKPIERLAAGLRVRAHAEIDSADDGESARYLGDLAPAATALQDRLKTTSQSMSEAIAEETNRLREEQSHLVRILSDVPVATLVVSQDHKIALYDGQAAELLEAEAPIRLNASLFDYLDGDAIHQALAELSAAGKHRMPITLKGLSGAVYSGHIRVFDDDHGYGLMLEPLAPEAGRPLIYDFDLLERPVSQDLQSTPLRALTYVAFDSETTGLNPEKDDVVQIGAVRIVNGKTVPGEVYEKLVNPGRPIPPGSTKVHHITNEMVADAAVFSDVCCGFHRFTKGAVLIAHNAPFDMAFLHREEKNTGLKFDHPVIDTVHLSAIVFGGSAEHTLDALCDRLQITIPPEVRHTAMGDAVATAAAFNALLPVLEARGITTFGEARAEARKHSRILKTEG